MKISAFRSLVASTILFLTSGLAEAIVYEDFRTDPILSGRFLKETSDTETQFYYNIFKGSLKAFLDVDKNSAYYLSKEFEKITEKDSASFSVTFRVESYDGRSSPTAFIGLTTTRHVENYGDGLTMIVSTREGRLSVNASIDQSGTKVEGAPISIGLGVDYKATASYSPLTRQLDLTIFEGSDFTVLLGRSTAQLPEGKIFSLDRLGLQNGGARVTDQTVGSISLVVDDLFMPAHGPPIISIANQSIQEGDDRVSSAVFNVTLAFPSETEVGINYLVGEGSAKAGSDYAPQSGKLVFPPGTTLKTISIPVFGDSLVEADETFIVKLETPINATLGTAQAIGTIQNDDLPTVTATVVPTIEGNAGAVISRIDFNLSVPFDKPVSFEYTTFDGSALGSIDYEPQTGLIVFPQGTTNQTITIKIIGETITEPDEEFFLRLRNLSNCNSRENQISCKIVNDDALPFISIEKMEGVEGNLDRRKFVFKVNLSNQNSETVSVGFSTESDTALKGIDFDDNRGLLKFPPGTSQQSLVVDIIGDSTDEPDESFVVNLSNPTHATIGTRQAIGLILNDDPRPNLIYANQSITEGDTGKTTMSISVQLSNPSSRTITVDYKTQDQTALSGVDYESKVGSLTFLPGVVTQFVPVTIFADRVNEVNEVFRFVLDNSQNGVININSVACSILNDDGGTIVIDDVKVTEANNGSALAIFTVRLSESSPQTVTVNYSTEGGTATSDLDYRSKSGLLTFPPGTVAQPVSVAVYGDTVDESDEVFYVNLSNSQNSTIIRSQGIGTIYDDDLPNLFISNGAVVEGDAGLRFVTITLQLSSSLPDEITVEFATADGLAVAGADYKQESGKVIFSPGVTNQTIAIQIFPDIIDETNETFSVFIKNPKNALIKGGMAEVVILDDDPEPKISVNDLTISEGSGSITTAAFSVQLSQMSEKIVSGNYATINDSAEAGTDYIAQSGTFSFEPGITNRTVSIQIISDKNDEPSEKFYLALNGILNALIEHQSGSATIIDDDLPSILVNDVSAQEGDQGLTEIKVPIRLSSESLEDVVVKYKLVNGSATINEDFVEKTGQVLVPAGATQAFLSVFVKGDLIFEPNENFKIYFSDSKGGVLKRDSTDVLIINDDIKPDIFIDDSSIVEGDEGTVTLQVVVRLSAPSSEPIEVSFATSNGDSISPVDYIGLEGKIVLQPGSLVGYIPIIIIADTLGEFNEKFLVTLKDAGNAKIVKPTGWVSIIDDDLPQIKVVGVSVSEGDGQIGFVDVTVSLSAPATNEVVVFFNTVDGTALAYSDYISSRGKIVFPPRSIVQNIRVVIKPDQIFERDEMFFIQLKDPSGAVLAAEQTSIVILNDDVLPSLIIDENRITEGDFGNVAVRIPIHLSEVSGDLVTIQYTTKSGTAEVDLDFEPMTGEITLPPGTKDGFITVFVKGDTLSEGNEVFLISVQDVSGAFIKNKDCPVTIVNDDPSQIFASGAVVMEGQAGMTNAIFFVDLTFPSQKEVRVEYFIEDGSAKSKMDFDSISGSVVFSPGIVRQLITVPILGDAIIEDDETFIVSFQNPVNATLQTSQVTGVIINDDFPVVTAVNISNSEGNMESKDVFVKVLLTAPSLKSVLVEYQTVDGTAAAPADYFFKSGLITFPPGVTNQTVSVKIIGDTVAEPNEFFTIKFGSHTNCILGVKDVQCEIVNDDKMPFVTVNDAVSKEGDFGVSQMEFIFELSQRSSDTVTVDFSVVNGGAVAGRDFEGKSGVLNFPPGSTRQAVLIDIIGDGSDEPDESFLVRLSNVNRGILARSEAVGTIVDDDPAPRISIVNKSIIEGDTGVSLLVVPVKLSHPSARVVSVDYKTSSVSASPGLDYIERSGQLIFLPGVTNQVIVFTVNGDALVEPNEVFQVKIANSVNAVIDIDTAMCGIINDDGLTLAIDDISVSEGNIGKRLAVLNVRLSGVSSQNVLVDYLTVDDSAQSPVDYDIQSGTLSFPTGTLVQQISLFVNGDLSDELNETFFLDLRNPRNATILKDRGVINILDDDPPAISIIESEVNAAGGPTTIIVVVKLSTPSKEDVSFDYFTADDTATSGSDYEPKAGTVVVPAGEVRAEFVVPVRGNTLDEGTEKFVVRLANSKNGTIATPAGEFRIINKLPVNSPPEIALVAPVGGEVYFVGDNVQVEAHLTDPNMVVSNVGIYLGEIFLTNFTGGPLRFVWTNVPAGQFAISARASGRDGILAVSNPANIEVRERSVNLPPSLGPISDLRILENSTPQAIALTGISSGALDEVQALTVTATSDNPGLIPIPAVVYTSPNAVGTLSYQLVAGVTGKATITVTVRDDGGVLNGGQDTFSRQFTVTVLPINRAPTLDALADVKLLQNAPSQTVNLRGISSGALDEVQALTVTATSDNPGLIPKPRVTYTSPNAVGTLSYELVAGVMGKATITVTVRDDGGALNGGQDTFSRQFTVTVLPINRAPTLDALVDFTLLQDAPSQTVNLRGISSGAVDEVQVLTVTATSDNPGLIPKPTVTYTSPNPVGTLSYQLVAGVTGKATITVTVRDDGGALNGGQDTFSRQFVVDVTRVDNKAPEVQIVSPQDGLITTVDSPITVVAEAKDPDGTISKVEFFQNSNQLIGNVSSGPYQVTVKNLTEGKHSFCAKATDNFGMSAISSVVNITVLGERRDVAVIKVSPDPKFDILTQYISEVQLSGQQESLTWKSFERSEVSFEVLSRYRVVIWNDPHPTIKVATSEITLLKRLLQSGVTVYSIGPKLATAADGLEIVDKTDWRSIVNLSSMGKTAEMGQVELIGDENHGPILDGLYGTVAAFKTSGTVDVATATASADSSGMSGGCDVYVSFPPLSLPDSALTRRFSQIITLAEYGDESSIEERRKVFKNAICWLLDCNRCAVINLTLLPEETQIEPAVPKTGEQFSLKLQFTQNAECPATGVRVKFDVPLGLTVLGATTEQGEVSYGGTEVNFSLGRLGVHKVVPVELKLRSQIGGIITNNITFYANGLTSTSVVAFHHETAFTILGDSVPIISADRDVTGNVRLRVSGQVGMTYVIEKSTAIAGNGQIQWSAVKEFTLAAPEYVHIHVIDTTTSSAMFRVRKR